MSIGFKPYIEYPVLQVRPWGLLAYDRREYFTGKKPDRTNNKPPPRQLYTGQLTSYSRSRCKRALNLLVAIAEPKEAINFKTGKMFKFNLNFVTLTLSASQGRYSDKEIKKDILDVWLKRARRIFKLRHYVWRAERQINGNIHFHIVTDCYMHFEKLRNSWNECQNRLGFIDQFEKKHGHRNPNSTDVHSLQKVRNLAAYFIKYMTKGQRSFESIRGEVELPASIQHSEQFNIDIPRPSFLPGEFFRIHGKLWDCSLSLKTKANCEMALETEALATWTAASENESLKRKDCEMCSMIFLDKWEFDRYVTGAVRHHWHSYLATLRNKVPIDLKVT
jgi:hypothetical protein